MIQLYLIPLYRSLTCLQNSPYACKTLAARISGHCSQSTYACQTLTSDWYTCCNFKTPKFSVSCAACLQIIKRRIDLQPKCNSHPYTDKQSHKSLVRKSGVRQAAKVGNHGCSAQNKAKLWLFDGVVKFEGSLLHSFTFNTSFGSSFVIAHHYDLDSGGLFLWALGEWLRTLHSGLPSYL